MIETLIKQGSNHYNVVTGFLGNEYPETFVFPTDENGKIIGGTVRAYAHYQMYNELSEHDYLEWLSYHPDFLSKCNQSVVKDLGDTE